VCRSKHVEQLRNTGIINSTTRSHLVGYFYKKVTLLSQFIECILADQWNSSSARQFGKQWTVLARQPEYGSKANLVTKIYKTINSVDNLTMAKQQQ
jgi:hypothetical protein